LWPSFSLTLDAGRLGDELLSVISLNPWLAHALIGMELPIYTGGALKAQVKIATAQQLHNAQLANCIRLHLALGGSFDAQPAEQLDGVPG
jgi:outer membrane protein TolC